MNIYKLVGKFRNIKSDRIRLLGVMAMHLARRRYIGIFMDPSMTCNLSCQMCYFSDAGWRKELLKTGSMSVEHMETVAKALFKRALKLQIGCGAEPTVYKHLTQLVALGKAYGVPYISITTNGQLLSQTMLDSLLQEGLNELTISVHGLCRETYEELMRGGRFDQFIKVVNTIRETRKAWPELKVRINYTMNEDNVEDLALFEQVFGSLKPDVLQLRPIQDLGDSAYTNFSLKKIEEGYERLIVPIVEYCKRENIVCIYPCKENLRLLDDSDKPSLASEIEMFTYCNVRPKACWHEDFDPYTETFDSYSRKHHVLWRMTKLLMGVSKKKMSDKETTQMLNYEVEA